MLLMLKTPTEDSVEVCFAFLKQCGAKLAEIAPRALGNVFSRLRNILAEAQLDSRMRYMIETVMAIRRDKFADYPALIDEPGLISEEDQITHALSLKDAPILKICLTFSNWTPILRKMKLPSTRSVNKSLVTPVKVKRNRMMKKVTTKQLQTLNLNK
ncbi:unnamed protein product, partial [Mesorhabditis belari]|uniref:MIF4G domain-containing protein n=1 Tax=Mesorhabditis belari TaxID=2138241 RepID=A0AAF3FD97_9BILA